VQSGNGTYTEQVRFKTDEQAPRRLAVPAGPRLKTQGARSMKPFDALRAEIGSAEIAKVLGYMDPLNMSFHFDSDIELWIPPDTEPLEVPNEDLANLSDEEKHILLTEGLVDVEMKKLEYLSDIPNWLLVHELSHQVQATATSSGIRNFMELNAHQWSCIRLIREVRSLSGGKVNVGIVNSAERYWSKSPEFRAALLTIEDDYRRLFANGGGKLQTSVARRYTSANAELASTFKCEDLIPGIQTTWCMDLTKVGGPEGVSVILGNRHLYEGYAFAVEQLRAVADNSDDYEPYWVQTPYDPYRVTHVIYRSLAGQPGRIWPDLMELAVVLDTALMYDNWLTTRLDTPEKSDTLWPNWNGIDHFIRMCDTIGSSRGQLRLGNNMEPDNIVAFQDALLKATGAPISSVLALTEAAIGRYPKIISEIAYLVPPMGIVADTWSRAFEHWLNFRIQTAKGASPALHLVYAPIRDLHLKAASLSTRSSRVIVPITDGSKNTRIYNVEVAIHIRSVLDEIVLGRSRCPVRAKCQLPARAACEGVTPSLEPEGHRCAREGAIDNIIAGIQIDTLVI